MNTYIIAPKVVRINLDKELNDSFSDVERRLRWRPLTPNLDSCEESPYLYFRITLKLRNDDTNTYAGFSTGAPFILARDIDVKKRAFFLRHWVRHQPTDAHANAPVVQQKHMLVGASDNRLLIRVEIDRPLVADDTFKSIPFATMMFQIVQVDAVIQQMPNVRLAFAIERTVTPDERDVLSMGEQTTPAFSQITQPRQPSTIPPPLPPPTPQQQKSQLTPTPTTTPTTAATSAPAPAPAQKTTMTTTITTTATPSVTPSISPSPYKPQLIQPQQAPAQHPLPKTAPTPTTTTTPIVAPTTTTTTPLASPRKSPPAAQFIKPASTVQRIAQHHPTPVQAPAMQQNVLYQRTPTAQPARPSLLSPRTPAGLYPHNPYQFVTNPHHRQVPMQMRPGVAGARPVMAGTTMLTPQHLTPANIRAASQRNYARGVATGGVVGIPAPSTTPTPGVTTIHNDQIVTKTALTRPTQKVKTNSTATSATAKSTATTTVNTSVTTAQEMANVNRISVNTPMDIAAAAAAAVAAKATLNNNNNILQSNNTNATRPHYAGVTDNTRANMHPDVKLWEVHDANDPYEPIFISEDVKFEERAKRKVILDHATEQHDRFNYTHLFGFCASDFPPFYTDGPDVHVDGDEADIEIAIEKIPKDKVDFGLFQLGRSQQQLQQEREQHDNSRDRDELVHTKDYHGAIIAATTYNCTLGDERKDLKQWLVEDAERQEARSEEEEEEDDGDSMSE